MNINSMTNNHDAFRSFNLSKCDNLYDISLKNNYIILSWTLKKLIKNMYKKYGNFKLQSMWNLQDYSRKFTEILQDDIKHQKFDIVNCLNFSFSSIAFILTSLNAIFTSWIPDHICDYMSFDTVQMGSCSENTI